jgi:hypothetical protein
MRVLSASERCKLDQLNDREFYSSARMVHHVGAAFRRRLTSEQRLPPAGCCPC